MRPVGVFGCAQSHINVWKDVVEKGYENVLILEDDGTLEENFKSYIDVLEPPETWDILYLGALFPILENRSEGHFTRCKALGTHAYIINKKCARRESNPRMTGWSRPVYH